MLTSTFSKWGAKHNVNLNITVNNMADRWQDKYMAETDHVDGSICTNAHCNEYWSAYAGEIPDFTHTTVEQVDEWTGAGTYHGSTQVVDEVIDG